MIPKSSMVCRSHSSSLAEGSKTKKFSPFWNICSRIINEFMKTMNPKEVRESIFLWKSHVFLLHICFSSLKSFHKWKRQLTRGDWRNRPSDQLNKRLNLIRPILDYQPQKGFISYNLFKEKLYNYISREEYIPSKKLFLWRARSCRRFLVSLPPSKDIDCATLNAIARSGSWEPP